MDQRTHPLHRDFPADLARIDAVRQVDPHFAEIVARFEEVDREIGKIDAREELRTDDEEKVLREHRVALRDAIAQRLREEGPDLQARQRREP
ncbi:MAG: YdcH family protein [Salinarimonas sp.]